MLHCKNERLSPRKDNINEACGCFFFALRTPTHTTPYAMHSKDAYEAQQAEGAVWVGLPVRQKCHSSLRAGPKVPVQAHSQGAPSRKVKALQKMRLSGLPVRFPVPRV